MTTTNCIRITKQGLNLTTQVGWSKDMTTQIPTEKHNDKAVSTNNILKEILGHPRKKQRILKI